MLYLYKPQRYKCSASSICGRSYGGKCKGQPRTGNEGKEGELKYSSSLSYASALDAGGWSTPSFGRFTPREIHTTHFIACWVGPRVGLDMCRHFGPTGIRYPDSVARSESLCRLSYGGQPETGRVAATVSNRETAENGRSSSLLFGRVKNNSSPANTQRPKHVKQGPRPGISTSVSTV
jgi:hypothetical protein